MVTHLENLEEGTPEELQAFREVWHDPAECSAHKFTLWLQRRGPGEKLGVGGASTLLDVVVIKTDLAWRMPYQRDTP